MEVWRDLKDKLLPQSESETVPDKIQEINIDQKSKSLKGVTGLDVSTSSNGLELGKVEVKQEADSMDNVTGVKLQGNNNSGAVVLKDKMSIEQKTPQGKKTVQFNADHPGVDIRFFDKSK